MWRFHRVVQFVFAKGPFGRGFKLRLKCHLNVNTALVLLLICRADHRRWYASY